MFEGTNEGYEGTPGQSQAGPGAPPRDTTLCTEVHTQLADGEQETSYNAYSPYCPWIDLESGTRAVRSAGSARPAAGAAAGARHAQAYTMLAPAAAAAAQIETAGGGLKKTERPKTFGKRAKIHGTHPKRIERVLRDRKL